MPLRRRVALIAAGAVAFAVVLVSLAAFVVTGRELRGEVDASLTEGIASIQILARRGIDLDRLGGLPGLGRGPIPGGRIPLFEGTYWQIVLPGGSVLAPEAQAVSLPVPDDLAAIAETPRLEDEIVDGVHLRVATALVPPVGHLQVARSLAEVDATLSGLGLALVVIGIVGTVAAGAVGLVVARSSLKPIDDLSDAAGRVAATQDLEQQIVVDRDDEVGRLAASFNTMLAALEESRMQQRRLVRDAGHELRTPLTALRVNVEMLARGDDLSAEQRAALLAAATEEVEALSSLVAEVVDLATDRYAAEPKQPADLREIVEESAARSSRRTGREIRVEGSGVVADVRRGAVARAVDNLLDNADKWSPPGAPIDVDVSRGRVAVSDRGPGIAERDRSRVFERFYRAETARAMPGSGLGLSIVEQIAREHGGSVFVEAGREGGAVVGFELPVG